MLKAANAYPTTVFGLKMMSANYIRCIFSNAHQNIFIMIANTMNPDQTAQSDLGPYCLQHQLPKYISSERADTNCGEWKEKH